MSGNRFLSSFLSGFTETVHKEVKVVVLQCGCISCYKRKSKMAESKVCVSESEAKTPQA